MRRCNVPPSAYDVHYHQILIDVERLPTAGGLTMGTWPAYDLAPGLAAASGQVRAVVGIGCDDLHATQEGQPGAPAGSP